MPLLAANGLQGFCADFPTSGTVCIPSAKVCQPYQLKVDLTDTCASIAQQKGVTWTQLVSWNPELGEYCENIGDLAKGGQVICVSTPGGAWVNPFPETESTTTSEPEYVTQRDLSDVLRRNGLWLIRPFDAYKSYSGRILLCRQRSSPRPPPRPLRPPTHSRDMWTPSRTAASSTAIYIEHRPSEWVLTRTATSAPTLPRSTAFPCSSWLNGTPRSGHAWWAGTASYRPRSSTVLSLISTSLPR